MRQNLINIVIRNDHTFGLCLNSDSSICTMTPGPPSTIGILKSFAEHTSRSQLYRCHMQISVISASIAISVTGYSLDHHRMASIHFWRVSFDFEKKDPSLIDLVVLHEGQYQHTPSDPAWALALWFMFPLHLKEHMYKLKVIAIQSSFQSSFNTCYMTWLMIIEHAVSGMNYAICISENYWTKGQEWHGG